MVPYEGNAAALKVMEEVFELRPHFEWRGLGFISQSALRLSDAYAELDAVYGSSVRADLKKLEADAKAQAQCT